MKNLLFTKLNLSFIMGNASISQNENKREYACLLGIKSVVNRIGSFIGMLWVSS
jgi:hypothetical protein